MFSFCNHAEQLQHQRPFQPFLLRDSQGQPWPVVSRTQRDLRSARLGMAKWHLYLTHSLFLFRYLPLNLLSILLFLSFHLPLLAVTVALSGTQMQVVCVSMHRVLPLEELEEVVAAGCYG